MPSSTEAQARSHFTTSSSSKSDNHASHVWLFEPPTTHGVLTREGLDQIVHHKYKAGTYTALDLFLNPLWQYWTDQLPLWLAPNAVTALGGCFALVSYILTAHHALDLWSQEQALVPNEVLMFNGLCLLVYYTLDCMDGKQARRTQSSSPLGQLFDHGVDCLANLSHLSLMQAIVQWKAHHYMLLQCSMQLGFFQAQLEEYYTGSLPHAAGNLGTTEVLYGMGVWSILTGALGYLGLLDRTAAAFFQQDLPSWVPNSITSGAWGLPGIDWVLDAHTISSSTTDSYGATDTATMHPLQIKELMIVIWVYGFGVLAILSWIRLWVKISKDKTTNDALKLGASALCKWVSPLILCALACDAATCTTHSSISVPIGGGIRYPSLAIGLAMCMLTIKLVVLGMARMAYATFQYADVLPLVAVWLVLSSQSSGRINGEESSNSSGAAWLPLLYPLATVGYLIRLVWWTRSAVDPLCQRMNIRLFRIPHVSAAHDGKHSSNINSNSSSNNYKDK